MGFQLELDDLVRLFVYHQVNEYCKKVLEVVNNKEIAKAIKKIKGGDDKINKLKENCMVIILIIITKNLIREEKLKLLKLANEIYNEDNNSVNNSNINIHKNSDEMLDISNMQFSDQTRLFLSKLYSESRAYNGISNYYRVLISSLCNLFDTNTASESIYFTGIMIERIPNW